ncbi:protein of unknown function [Pseudorhizobium banfieldiae]|uniref:Uncharacterized protein n=1 Tax=Pseudorhizobium banfieldiae TaxID=1125847 RepID=L0NKJ1_9HYPH|nr:protein of unknown function [Pseudorhizobium banfieldiae]
MIAAGLAVNAVHGEAAAVDLNDMR